MAKERKRDKNGDRKENDLEDRGDPGREGKGSFFISYSGSLRKPASAESAPL